MRFSTEHKALFDYDETKSFRLMDKYSGEIPPNSLALDVIFHWVEDDIYKEHRERLFDCAERFVIIYSSNTKQELRGSVAPWRRGGAARAESGTVPAHSEGLPETTSCRLVTSTFRPCD